MDKSKIHFEEREYYFPTDIGENELCDDEVSDDGDYFTDRDCASSEENFEGKVSYGTKAYDARCGCTRNATVRVHLRVILAICTHKMTERNISISCNMQVYYPV
jgi:hypothetical protein